MSIMDSRKDKKPSTGMKVFRAIFATLGVAALVAAYTCDACWHYVTAGYTLIIVWALSYGE